MKTKKTESKVKLLKGVRVNPNLNGKYDDKLFFKEKAAKAEQILKTYGVPKI